MFLQITKEEKLAGIQSTEYMTPARPVEIDLVNVGKLA